jgi:phosphate starvation-inducible protein PhoH and related proteins
MPVKIVKALDFELVPTDNSRLANLCGQFNEHLHQLESHFDVGIACRSNHFQIEGRDENQRAAMAAIKNLYDVAGRETLTPSIVQLYLNESNGKSTTDQQQKDDQHRWSMKTSKATIKGRGKNQVDYLKQIRTNDLTLGIGPAGTGKTYLAVASAVNALENDEVQRLVLVRPAVEAGERLGFLPGDLAQKIDPYLRPMYDALYEMMGFQKVAKLIERNVIEIAPLAYMRGRTLNDSFIILDEAQNTTIDQMKMFLTRIGFGSRAVVTGDITQVDLPRDKMSGLRHSMLLLKDVEGIGITQFTAADVVRHPLVKKIVAAYEKDDPN